MKEFNPPSKRHQLLQAIRILSTVVQFTEKNIDFSTDIGKEIICEAKAACQFLEHEIKTQFPIKTTMSGKGANF